MEQGSDAQPPTTNTNPRTRAELLKFAHDQEDIINCYDTAKCKKCPRPQDARAKPNQRLVYSFGVDNAFTTRNPGEKGTFVANARKKMKTAIGINGTTDEGDWSKLLKATRQYLDQYAKTLKDDKVSIHYLFNDDVCHTALRNSDLNEIFAKIGEEINETWIRSKESTETQIEFKNSELCAMLKLVFLEDTPKKGEQTHDPDDPKKNPMNWLLPAYETMWRVVMRCVIEILYRDAKNGANWKATLSSYLEALQHPKEANVKPFKRKNGGVAVHDIVKEALRLYPPSHRIHREFEIPDAAEPGKTRIEKADIEKCHHSTLFGSDPLVFRPERWQEIRREYEELCNEKDSEKYKDYRDYLGLDKEGETEKKKKKEAKTETEPQTTLDNRKKKKTDDIKRYEQYLGFMPFANICPSDENPTENTSTKAFGMKMIALLVGVLCEGLGGWEPEERESLLDRSTPLLSGRKDYGCLFLVRGGGGV